MIWCNFIIDWFLFSKLNLSVHPPILMQKVVLQPQLDVAPISTGSLGMLSMSCWAVCTSHKPVIVLLFSYTLDVVWETVNPSSHWRAKALFLLCWSHLVCHQEFLIFLPTELCRSALWWENIFRWWHVGKPLDLPYQDPQSRSCTPQDVAAHLTHPLSSTKVKFLPVEESVG